MTSAEPEPEHVEGREALDLRPREDQHDAGDRPAGHQRARARRSRWRPTTMPATRRHGSASENAPVSCAVEKPSSRCIGTRNAANA